MNGIALLIDGEALDLGDAKVRLKMQSPLFEAEFIKHSYSYPFVLPWSHANARLLRHAERLANTEQLIELTTDIHLGGIFWRRGTLKYRRYRGGFDCDLLIPPDATITTLGDTNLQDIDMGTITMLPGSGDDPADLDVLYSTFLGPSEDTPFIFAPVKNARPVGDHHTYDGNENDPNFADPRPDGYVNHYDENGTYKWFWWEALPTQGEIYTLHSPFPYLSKVLEAVMAVSNVDLVGTVLQHAEFQRMVVVGNYLQLSVLQTSSGIIVNFEDIYGTLDLAKALPNMTCLQFLVAIQQRFNARIIFDITGSARFITMNEVLGSPHVWDISELAAPSLDSDNAFADGYILKETEDPLDALGSDRDNCLNFQITYTVDSVDDLAGLTIVNNNEVAYVLSAGMLYRYSMVDGTLSWVLQGPYLPSSSSGNKEKEYTVGVALTNMYAGPDTLLNTREWLTPEVEMVLSDVQLDMYGIGRNDRSVLRLLFYRGLQQDSVGDTYPLLTNGTLDYAGNAITGAEWSERIHSDDGIHALWYEAAIERLANAKTITRSVRLPLTDMVQFDFTKKVAIDGLHYLVQTIDVEFTTNGVGIPRLDLIKV